MTGAPGGRTRGTREGKGVGTEILAWVGAVLSSLFRLPQAYRAARTDDLAVLAPGSYWLMPADAVVWSAWAVITDQLAAGVRQDS